MSNREQSSTTSLDPMIDLTREKTHLGGRTYEVRVVLPFGATLASSVDASEEKLEGKLEPPQPFSQFANNIAQQRFAHHFGSSRAREPLCFTLESFRSVVLIRMTSKGKTST